MSISEERSQIPIHTIIVDTEEAGVVIVVTAAIQTITTTTILFYGEGEAGAEGTTEPLTTQDISPVPISIRRSNIEVTRTSATHCK